MCHKVAHGCVPINAIRLIGQGHRSAVAFIQSNDDQIICMENSLHTNGDSIVNTAFKELNILP